MLYFFLRIFSLRYLNHTVGTEPVSVIICAKNEARNLRQNLPAILTQRYTNDAGKYLYEVIVVNDASDDDGDTEYVLNKLKEQYTHLKVITIPPGMVHTLPGKKYALSQGVAAATYDWLVMTDADCMPASNIWLSSMVASLAKGKQIVAGYGAYHSKKGLLNSFTRAETIHTFLQYSTYALAGYPYMAVGRNMACTREVMMQAQQSEAWSLLPSGDDDLLVMAAGNKRNVGIVFSQQAFTITEAKDSWTAYVAQKRRHLSTGKYYKPQIKFLLSLYGSTHALLWILFILLMFSAWWEFALLLMFFRCIIFWTIMAATATRLGEKKITLFMPVFDFGWLLYNFVFSPYIIWKNKKQWK